MQEYKIIINGREYRGIIIEEYDNGMVVLQCKGINFLVRGDDLEEITETR